MSTSTTLFWGPGARTLRPLWQMVASKTKKLENVDRVFRQKSKTKLLVGFCGLPHKKLTSPVPGWEGWKLNTKPRGRIQQRQRKALCQPANLASLHHLSDMRLNVPDIDSLPEKKRAWWRIALVIFVYVAVEAEWTQNHFEIRSAYFFFIPVCLLVCAWARLSASPKRRSRLRDDNFSVRGSSTLATKRKCLRGFLFVALFHFSGAF